jgi:ATP-dependent DNA helicase RecQ
VCSSDLVTRVPARKEKKMHADVPPGVETTLFTNLRRLRLLLARKLGIPPYMVFADSVLTSMALLRPQSPEDLRQIMGIGDKKCERYGQAFLAVIEGCDADSVAGGFA